MDDVKKLIAGSNVDKLEMMAKYKQLNQAKKLTEKEVKELYIIAELWREKRSQVLNSTDEIEEELRSSCKLMSFLKMMIYSADVFDIVAIVFNFAEHYSFLASVLKIVGTLAMVNVKIIDKIQLKRILKPLEEDYTLLAIIQAQYFYTEELQRAMESIFPFDIMETMVTELSFGHKLFSISELLEILLEKRICSVEVCQNTKCQIQKRKIQRVQNVKVKTSFLWNWFIFEETENYYTRLIADAVIYRIFKTIWNQESVNPAIEKLKYYIFGTFLLLRGLPLIKEFYRLRTFIYPEIFSIRILKNYLTYEKLELMSILHQGCPTFQYSSSFKQ